LRLALHLAEFLLLQTFQTGGMLHTYDFQPLIVDAVVSKHEVTRDITVVEFILINSIECINTRWVTVWWRLVPASGMRERPFDKKSRGGFVRRLAE
jgi:hypothetical protein